VSADEVWRKIYRKGSGMEILDRLLSLKMPKAVKNAEEVFYMKGG
jgi:hypothetical protein